MTSGLVGPEEAERNLNALEKLVRYFSSDDEYKAAMLRNQKIMAKTLLDMAGNVQRERVSPTNVDIDDLPIGLTGSAVGSIPSGERGKALFDISGSKFESSVKPTGDVKSNETVIVVGHDNKVRPAGRTSSALSVLTGSGGQGRNGVMSPGNYGVYESADLTSSEDDGTIKLEPGDTSALVKSDNYSNGAFILAVGADDRAGVTYELQRDGDQSVGGVTQAPLGTVANPFSFHSRFGAIFPVNSEARYVAKYSDSGSGNVNISARLHMYESGT